MHALSSLPSALLGGAEFVVSLEIATHWRPSHTLFPKFEERAARLVALALDGGQR